MKKLRYITVVVGVMGLLSCTGRTENAGGQMNDSLPGPVSEMDKSRYNLNATDENLYGTTDTLKQDSLEKADSLERR